MITQKNQERAYCCLNKGGIKRKKKDFQDVENENGLDKDIANLLERQKLSHRGNLENEKKKLILDRKFSAFSASKCRKTEKSIYPTPKGNDYLKAISKADHDNVRY